jgi:hypothetical protein
VIRPASSACHADFFAYNKRASGGEEIGQYLQAATTAVSSRATQDIKEIPP